MPPSRVLRPFGRTALRYCTSGEVSQRGSPRSPKLGGPAAELAEALVGDRHLLGEEALDRLGEGSDLVLRGVGVAQAEEVHQRASIDGPVELRVDADRKDG